MKLTVFRTLFLIFCLTLALPVSAQQELPIETSDPVVPIKKLQDPELQHLLEAEICNNSKWSQLVAKKKMSIGIVDFSDIDNIRYAGLNDDVMMYAASLPKIAILLAAMDAIEKGELENTSEIQNDLRLMISKSDNQASTRMIDRL